MRFLGIVGLVGLCLVALGVLLPANNSSADVGSAEYQMGSAPAPVGTPDPERQRYYKSYPAPTGQAGFRKYYQKRCYPGCHYGNAIVTPETSAETHTLPEAKPTQVRYYRSYPAPTGEAGFRKYYQKRCYPGCHYGGQVVTPEPNAVHP